MNNENVTTGGLHFGGRSDKGFSDEGFFRLKPKGIKLGWPLLQEDKKQRENGIR